MPGVRCWHCRASVKIDAKHVGFWRCGECRRINGRPPSARGWQGIKCGVCSFYSSRIVHGGAWLVMVGIIGSGLFWALPRVSKDYRVAPKCGVWFLSLALSSNVVYSFVVASQSDPGSVPRVELDDVPWCDICDNVKPPRCHHCSTCSRCVYEMDHHCQFLHNCVGAGNLNHFVRLLVSLLMGCGFVAGFAALEVLRTVLDGTTDLSAHLLFRRGSHTSIVAILKFILASRDGRYVILGTLAFGVFVAVAGLTSLYVWLAATGETGLERSARLYRGGIDYRTYPGWRAALFPTRRSQPLTAHNIVESIKKVD